MIFTMFTSFVCLWTVNKTYNFFSFFFKKNEKKKMNNKLNLLEKKIKEQNDKILLLEKQNLS